MICLKNVVASQLKSIILGAVGLWNRVNFIAHSSHFDHLLANSARPLGHK